MNTYTIENYDAEIMLTSEDMKKGVLIKFDLPYPYYDSGKLKLRFCNGHVSDDAPRNTNGALTIPGHSNCIIGECSCDCHVVSCSIHQGMMEEPYLCPTDSE